MDSNSVLSVGQARDFLSYHFALDKPFPIFPPSPLSSTAHNSSLSKVAFLIGRLLPICLCWLLLICPLFTCYCWRGVDARALRKEAMFNFLSRKNVRKMLKRKDSDAGDSGKRTHFPPCSFIFLVTVLRFHFLWECYLAVLHFCLMGNLFV